MQQSSIDVKIIKLVNGEDVVAVVPIGEQQLPDKSTLLRLQRPLLIKYVPQMTLAGFKDYVALIKWCSYTQDDIITIPKDKIMTMTSATGELANSYFNIASNYHAKPIPVRNNNYSKHRLSDDENNKINEIFDELEDEEDNKTIH